VPFYIVDPQFYESGMAADARLSFLHDAVADLDAAYRERESGLALRRGPPARCSRNSRSRRSTSPGA
jgi:deoxyribodipyrimidine photo-lyase